MSDINIIDVMASMPSEEEVRMKFLNTALEKYSHLVYTFWISEPLMECADKCHDSFRTSVIEYLKECLELAKCIKETRSGIIKGKGWKITNPFDANLLISKLELYFVEKLEGFEILFHGNLPEDTDKCSTARNWSTALKPFPRLDTLPIHYDKYLKNKESWHTFVHYFDIETISNIISNLEECIKITKTFTLEHDIHASTRFIAFMIDNGVPTTREVYRELYRALDMYGCIPDYVKKSHSKTTSSDPQSNYVKSLAKVAKGKLDLFE